MIREFLRIIPAQPARFFFPMKLLQTVLAASAEGAQNAATFATPQQDIWVGDSWPFFG